MLCTDPGDGISWIRSSALTQRSECPSGTGPKTCPPPPLGATYIRRSRRNVLAPSRPSATAPSAGSENHKLALNGLRLLANELIRMQTGAAPVRGLSDETLNPIER
jgi:hypothetical protein